MTRFILTALLFCAFYAPAQAAAGDTVILLHAIARSSGSMDKIEKSLASEGYRTINIDYDSRKKPIGELADDIAAEVSRHPQPEGHKLHFIGHSMGGLVIRAYIHKHRPRNLGRVVMLGTPNKGSEVADAIKDNFLYKDFYGPAGQELITDQGSIAKTLGRVDYELGIIAGDRSIDPISSLLLIPAADDGKVSVERTKVEGMQDHITLHTTHTFMIKNDDVIRQALFFIKNGTFSRNDEPGL